MLRIAPSSLAAAALTVVAALASGCAPEAAGGAANACSSVSCPASICHKGPGTCDPDTGKCRYEFKAPTFECRAKAGPCDIAEACTGSSGDCPADAFASGTIICRAAVGICDAEERCSGTSAVCPQDRLENQTMICRPEEGPCDVAEVCTGLSTTCPDDTFASAGLECRSKAGDCDVAEKCTGSAASCPADAVEPATKACRAASGACDIAESCNGTSALCPTDGFEPDTTLCRPAADATCDLAESCTGTSGDCPTDAFAASTVACRVSTAACDAEERCTGTSGTCPADLLSTADVVCRAAAGTCDSPEKCDGSTALCPADTWLGAGSVCRQAAAGCDAVEKCSGTSAVCPADAFLSATDLCRAAATPCDASEYCTGTSATCPADVYASNSTVCRASAGPCDPEEKCTGASLQCPLDGFSQTQTQCGPSCTVCESFQTCGGGGTAGQCGGCTLDWDESGDPTDPLQIDSMIVDPTTMNVILGVSGSGDGSVRHSSGTTWAAIGGTLLDSDPTRKSTLVTVAGTQNALTAAWREATVTTSYCGGFTMDFDRRVRARRWNGTSWSTPAVLNEPVGTEPAREAVSLATVRTSNVEAVAFVEQQITWQCTPPNNVTGLFYPPELRVKAWDGTSGSWVALGAGPLRRNTVLSGDHWAAAPAITASLGSPVAAWLEGRFHASGIVATRDALVSRWDGSSTSWVALGGALQTADQYAYSNIAIATLADGSPVVAFVETTGADPEPGTPDPDVAKRPKQVVVAAWNGSAWTRYGTSVGPVVAAADTLALRDRWRVALTVSASNTPYVMSLAGGVTQQSWRIHRWTGSAWEQVGTALHCPMSICTRAQNGTESCGGNIFPPGLGFLGSSLYAAFGGSVVLH